MRGLYKNTIIALCAISAASLNFDVSARAQNVDIGGIIGGLMQGAIQADIQHRQQDNQNRTYSRPRSPVANTRDEDEQQDESVADPIRDSRAYMIDGRALGDQLNSERLSADFKCTSSEQFQSFHWCRSRKQVDSVVTATSILLSRDNTISYYNKFFESANFGAGAVAYEIKRLSGLYHQKAQIMRMPKTAEGVSAIIAVWGALALNPVDQSTLALLASGQSVTSGLMVDFLGDVRASAKRGLPVYRIAGGPGYYWAARFNNSGEGNLRFGLGNAGVFDVAPNSGSTGPALAFSE